MPQGREYRRAPYRRPFCFWLINLALLFVSSVAPINNVLARCLPDHIDETVRVTQVLDGDTVILSGGRKLRLVGLDTPELGKDGEPNESYAIEARDYLRRLLFTHKQILALRHDSQRTDHYGRRLAHGFLKNGDSIAEKLLEKGYATRLVIPPNDWQLECYGAAEAAAIQARRGLWSLPRYRPIDSRALGTRDEGYRRVRGRVKRLGESRGALWLNLEGRFAMRITRNDLKFFNSFHPRDLVGTRVEVRGKVYRQKGESRVRVRHPAQITVLEK